MLVTEDRILAEVRRIADAIARMVGLGANGPGGRGALELVRDDLEEAHRALFGLPRDLTARVDPRSLAGMVRADHRAAALELLEVEAALLDANGDAASAELRRAQREALLG